MEHFVILKEDREWAEKRIQELEKAIRDLGPEFNEALNQSSESWHDNAPFDAAREKQAVLFAEYSNLRTVLRGSTIEVPRPALGTVGFGSIIKISDTRHTRKLHIVGDWTYRAGQHEGDMVIVSAQSPIAKGFMGQKVGTKTAFGVLSEILA